MSRFLSQSLSQAHLFPPLKTTSLPSPQLRTGNTIESKIHELLDYNVGLLIGYDCSQALTPREVIAGNNSETLKLILDGV